MAIIVGGITTSHIPLIGKAIARGWQSEAAWKPFFDSYEPVYAWLDRVRPDAVIVVYNDHGLGFFLDRMPTFAIGAAPEYRHADEGWGLPVVAPFPGDPALSWHIIESVVGDEFDVTTCQELLVDHAFTVPMALLWPGADPRPVRTVPVAVNHVQYPLPSPTRCYKFGQAIGRAIEKWPGDRRIVVVATGGLSHQLDGPRAGFLNRDFDLACLDNIVDHVEAITRYSTLDLARLSGAQGVELLTWLVMRGALSNKVILRHSSYHVPISSTAAAVMVLENAPIATAAA